MEGKKRARIVRAERCVCVCGGGGGGGGGGRRRKEGRDHRIKGIIITEGKLNSLAWASRVQAALSAIIIRNSVHKLVMQF